MVNSNVDAFANYLRAAPTDEKAERIVRTMLEGVARSCPMDVLVRLGQCVIDCRKSELEAVETNGHVG